MLNMLDKLTLLALVAMWVLGALSSNSAAVIGSMLGLLMYSLYLRLSDQIKNIKEQG